MKLLASLIAILSFAGIAIVLPPYLELYRYIFIVGIFFVAVALIHSAD
jgi:hypothetical protein